MLRSTSWRRNAPEPEPSRRLIAGLIVTATVGTNAQSAWATLGMVALLTGVTLVVAGAILRGRLR